MGKHGRRLNRPSTIFMVAIRAILSSTSDVFGKFSESAAESKAPAIAKFERGPAKEIKNSALAVVFERGV